MGIQFRNHIDDDFGDFEVLGDMAIGHILLSDDDDLDEVAGALKFKCF